MPAPLPALRKKKSINPTRDHHHLLCLPPPPPFFPANTHTA
jgi:hypothetical protein